MSHVMGVVALYVFETLSPCISNIWQRMEHVEALTLKLRIGNTPFLISCIYRRPVSDTSSYFEVEQIYHGLSR